LDFVWPERDGTGATCLASRRTLSQRSSIYLLYFSTYFFLYFFVARGKRARRGEVINYVRLKLLARWVFGLLWPCNCTPSYQKAGSQPNQPHLTPLLSGGATNTKMQKVNQQTQIQTLRPDKAGKTTPQTKKKKRQTKSTTFNNLDKRNQCKCLGLGVKQLKVSFIMLCENFKGKIYAQASGGEVNK